MTQHDSFIIRLILVLNHIRKMAGRWQGIRVWQRVQTERVKSNWELKTIMLKIAWCNQLYRSLPKVRKIKLQLAYLLNFTILIRISVGAGILKAYGIPTVALCSVFQWCSIFYWSSVLNKMAAILFRFPMVWFSNDWDHSYRQLLLRLTIPKPYFHNNTN